MPEVNSPYQSGTPCWIDLVVPDQQKALDFYSGFLGWTGEMGPRETGGYSVCTLKGRPVAGIMSAQSVPGDQPPPPTVWTSYFATDDASATERAITEAGGNILIPTMDVMSLGRMAIAADPTGAVFGIWQAKDFAGAGITNEPGALVWNELNTTDKDAAAAFYAKALGIETVPMEGAKNYFSLNVNGRAVGGLQETDKPETPSHWLVYFAVADADAAAAKVTANGGSVTQPPFDMEAGRLALVKDSQGAPFAFIAPSGSQSG